MTAETAQGIKEVGVEFYRIVVPMLNNPLRENNCYVIRAGERSLIIDTGMPEERSKEVLTDGLEGLGVDLSQADVLVTHHHWDHVGLGHYLAKGGAKVYLSQPDIDFIKMASAAGPERGIKISHVNGFPEGNGIEEDRKRHNHRSIQYPDFSVMEEGYRFCIGDYTFVAIETPGHTAGHMCFYDPEKKLFLSGDHALGTITPNIFALPEGDDTLSQYLESLDKVRDYDVDFVLPGHRAIYHNHQERIDQLKKHHQNRTDEVLEILSDGGKTAYEVASRMKWNVKYGGWPNFPPEQRWMAVGESVAHLKYGITLGKVESEIQGGVLVYR